MRIGTRSWRAIPSGVGPGVGVALGSGVADDVGVADVVGAAVVVAVGVAVAVGVTDAAGVMDGCGFAATMTTVAVGASAALTAGLPPVGAPPAAHAALTARTFSQTSHRLTNRKRKFPMPLVSFCSRG